MVASLCEICESNRQLRDGLCAPCTLEGLRKAQADDDPNLERYRELISRKSILPQEVAPRRTVG